MNCNNSLHPGLIGDPQFGVQILAVEMAKVALIPLILVEPPEKFYFLDELSFFKSFFKNLPKVMLEHVLNRNKSFRSDVYLDKGFSRLFPRYSTVTVTCDVSHCHCVDVINCHMRQQANIISTLFELQRVFIVERHLSHKD